MYLYAKTTRANIYLTHSQTFYIFFGVASLVGLFAGGVAYSISRVLVSVLGLKIPIAQDSDRVRKSLGGRHEGYRRLGPTVSKGGRTGTFEEMQWYGEPLTS